MKSFLIFIIFAIPFCSLAQTLDIFDSKIECKIYKENKNDSVFFKIKIKNFNKDTLFFPCYNQFSEQVKYELSIVANRINLRIGQTSSFSGISQEPVILCSLPPEREMVFVTNKIGKLKRREILINIDFIRKKVLEKLRRDAASSFTNPVMSTGDYSSSCEVLRFHLSNW